MKKLGVGLSIVLATGLALSAAGTTLSVVFGEPTVTCPDGNVSASYTLSTTAADAAIVTETLTNSSNATVEQNVYTIPAGNVSGGWIFAGRTKTYDGLFQASGLSNGTYSLQVCATQAGAGGNPDKTVCTSETIIVACADANPCANVGPHGEVVGNNRISVNAGVQIQFRGNFGPSALVEIRDTGNFYRSASVPRAGDSCEYHASWKFTNDSGADIFGNSGAGVYTVTVNGNGPTPLEFSVTLTN